MYLGLSTSGCVVLEGRAMSNPLGWKVLHHYVIIFLVFHSRLYYLYLVMWVFIPTSVSLPGGVLEVM